MPRTKVVASNLYCLRIELEGIAPPIWRRLWIDGGVTLLKLHHVIQAAMGWTDAHLHEFQLGGFSYAIPHPEDDPERVIVDERTVQLEKILKGISGFGYTYDFGDHWQHRITVERIEKATEMSLGYGQVEEGERACPPEDSGGPNGYQEFLDRLAKAPKGKDVREFLRWAGKDFDPARFDRHAANAALTRMAWNQWGEK
jgi:hypothetical protein